MFKKILKFLMIVALLVVLAVFILWVVIAKQFPWWVILALVLGFVGLWIGYIYLKKILLRRKEKEFVQRVVEQDKKAIEKAPPQERPYLEALHNKWKESVDLVRNSYLRKKGNPLYVLPWYMVIGESLSGKTSAIKNTNLNSPIGEVTRTAGISATRNCDWWFFEEAIILDTAGRYTIPVDEGPDKEEWQEFLTLLARYRRREPINGVIVTIAADKLLELNEAKLSDEGQSVRKRLDQLMRTLGAKFPIYLLVTKLDLVQGMVEFCRHLPKKSMDQAMGFINKNLNSDWRVVLDESISFVSDNLKNLRSIIVHQESQPEPEVFLFINEFERLRYGLEFFVQAVFDENPYQETPMLRGVFFSSAIQEGQPSTESTRLFGLDKQEIQDKVHNNGLFLKDFFKRILPEDRYLFSPLKEFVVWHRLTRNLGLLSWILLWICLGGLASFAYLNNMSALKVVTVDSYKPPRLTLNLAEDLVKLDQMRSRVAALEKANRRWYLPRWGFDESRYVQETLKNYYMLLFRDWVLNPFDTRLLKKIENSGDNTDKDVILEYIGYIEARINLLWECQQGKKTLSSERFQTVSTSLMTMEDEELTPETASIFAGMYLDYLLWVKDKKELEYQRSSYQAVLNRLLRKNEDLSWIVNKWQTGVPSVHLDEFWGDMAGIGTNEDIVIPGAYTAQGQRQIDAFFDRLEAVIIDTVLIGRRKKEFREWYQIQYYDAWGRFARNFNQCLTNEKDVTRWQQAAILMTTDRNPYFRFIERMAAELSSVEKINQEPSWVKLALDLNDIRQQWEIEKQKEKQPLVSEIISKKVQYVEQAFKKIDKKKAAELDFRSKAAKALGEYLATLEQISPALNTSESCFQLVSDYYTYNISTAQSQSLLTNAEVKYYKFKNMFNDREDIPFIWDLVAGPQLYILNYTVKEGACVLQQYWEDEVLGEIRGASEEAIPKILFDKAEGVIKKFVYGPAKPFLSRDEYGYTAKKGFTGLLPFHNVFFDFLNKGPESVIEYQPSYVVTLETLPLEVNYGAGQEPYASILRLQSTEGKFILENYNYPQSQTFRWSPETFGDVNLTVLFPAGQSSPEIRLTKTYEGKLGFADFLADFRDGSRTFKREEFPEEENPLKDIAVSWVKVSFKITGNQPVIDLLEHPPLVVPGEIVSCWARRSVPDIGL